MNISGYHFSVATNYAKLPPDQQEKILSFPGLKKTTFDFKRENQNLIKSLSPSDHDYTKKDAIMAQWLELRASPLEDLFSGKLNRRNPNPSAEVLQEFEKGLQSSGLPKEVDWGRLNSDLWGIGFDADKAAYSIEADDFTRKTSYLASR